MLCKNSCAPFRLTVLFEVFFTSCYGNPKYVCSTNWSARATKLTVAVCCKYWFWILRIPAILLVSNCPVKAASLVSWWYEVSHDWKFVIPSVTWNNLWGMVTTWQERLVQVSPANTTNSKSIVFFSALKTGFSAPEIYVGIIHVLKILWCMKWIWYEYAENGRSQSYPTACPQWEPHSKSYDWPTPSWSDGIVWCCGIMAASHGWRLLNTFHRYEVNLVWVWSGWEVPIISYSMSPVRTPLKILRLAQPLEWWYSMVLWHYDCQPWLKAFKHFL